MSDYNLNDEISDKLIQLVNAFKNLRQLSLTPKTEIEAMENDKEGYSWCWSA